ncbi:MAG: 4Fe-4S dicluster domain-containing protein [Gammaproteobacteria bacterium]|nr:4Fe-4S dicluster domain-containing protein [Gammaproteobacteria bacterium]
MSVALVALSPACRSPAPAFTDKHTYAISINGPTAQPSACIRCGQCNTVCPEALAADALHFACIAERTNPRVEIELGNCIECGACELACPSDIPLLAQFRLARTQLAARRDAADRATRALSRYARQQKRRSQHSNAGEEERTRRAHAPRPWLDDDP